MAPLSNKEYILETIKEVFNFILAVAMFLSCITIIIYGSIELHINYLGFIPFLYFAIIFSNRICKIAEEKENLGKSLAYYKHRVETYEKIYKESL